jgi:S-DNA-T family DNA segregation ATPase FtsK/SpoIIIE
LVGVKTGWPGLAGLAGTVLAALIVVRIWRPAWFARWVSIPAWCRWRWLRYKVRWQSVLTVAGLTEDYNGRVLVPVLGTVIAGQFADTVTVRLVGGQSPEVFADRADHLAHGLGVLSCRVRTGPPGMVLLELVRRDTLAIPFPALPIPDRSDLRALPVGCCEDGSALLLRLHGTHLLIAGATGSGKGSYLWSLIRAMLPAIAAGLVAVWACDPKLMELAFGRALFARYAADPGEIADLLEDAVTGMQDRARRFAGRQRDHQPTSRYPFTVIVVDEVAFLTAYQADRKLRERTLAALATLTTQGRAVGYCVVAALQDPRKEVLNIRNLFPDKIALRLDEPSQADLVLATVPVTGAPCATRSPPLPRLARVSVTCGWKLILTLFGCGRRLSPMTTSALWPRCSRGRRDHRVAVRRGLPGLRRTAARHQHRLGPAHPRMPRLRSPRYLAHHRPRPRYLGG